MQKIKQVLKRVLVVSEKFWFSKSELNSKITLLNNLELWKFNSDCKLKRDNWVFKFFEKKLASS